MNIYLSPAKVLNLKQPSNQPLKIAFNHQTTHLYTISKSFSTAQLQTELQISEKLATTVYEYYQQPVKSYEPLQLFNGDAFKAFDFDSLQPSEQQRAKQHILIGDAFYGLIRGTDRIAPYRLDFTKTFNEMNLYHYWQDLVQSHLEKPLIDLSSMEYQRLLPSYLDHPQIRLDLIKGSSILRKRFRGLAARAIIQQQISSINKLNKLEIPGFEFVDETRTHRYYQVVID